MRSRSVTAASYLALSPEARAVVREAGSADPALTTVQAVTVATLLGGSK